MRMLVCKPIIVVVITGSDDIMSPFKLQVKESGLSPFATTHVSWVNSPWLTTSFPNEKGMISGGSAIKYFQCQSVYSPFTKSSAECVCVPALFVALQVYVPLCLYPTCVMVKMLAWVPSMVVVRAGSDETTSPFRLQVIETGLSPFLMLHIIMAVSPWLTAASPKENGTISGGSANKTFPVHVGVFTLY